jgi:hypothetical protein
LQRLPIHEEDFWESKGLSVNDWAGLAGLMYADIFSLDFLTPLDDIDTRFRLEVCCILSVDCGMYSCFIVTSIRYSEKFKVFTVTNIEITMCFGPTNALVCNRTLIQMSHIKTLKIMLSCVERLVDKPLHTRTLAKWMNVCCRITTHEDSNFN